MRDLTDRPLACAALAFAAGIALVSAWPAALLVLSFAAVASVAVWLLARQAGLAGLALLALSGLAGALAYQAQEGNAGTAAALPPGGQTLVGTVAAAPAYSEGEWRFVLDAEAHEHGGQSEPVGGACYVRLRSTQPVRRGQRWRLTGRLRPLEGARNPGGHSEEARLAPLGVTTVFMVPSEQAAQCLGEGQLSWVAHHAYSAQGRALAALEREVPGPYRDLTASVAASVIFGVYASPLPGEISDAFRRAGTIHLLVVSGSMVSLVFGMVFLPGVVGRRWGRWWRERAAGGAVTGRGRIPARPGTLATTVAVLVVIYYAILTEGGQTVWRAAVMGVLVGAAMLLRRVPAVARQHGLTVDHYTTLGAAGLAILVLQPRALFLPGFQLSFTSVWALLFFLPKLEPRLGSAPKWLWEPAGATVAAQLAMLPILAGHYGNASLAGFLANLLAIPLAGVILYAGIATCALAAALPWLAPVTGWLTGLSTRALIWVSTAFGSLSWAAPEVRRPGWAVIAAWYVGLLVLGWWLARVADRVRQKRGV